MWITEFRQARGMTLEELGGVIRYYGKRRKPALRVSDTLLEWLEGVPGYRTVPALADLIAEVCGATPQQRDELVLEKYRGTWRGTGTPLEPPAKQARAARKRAVRLTWRGEPVKAVVAIDRGGNILARYPNVTNLSAHSGLHTTSIRRRCDGKTAGNEFLRYGLTYRYQDEWEKLTEEEKREELRKAATDESKARNFAGGLPVVAVNRAGAVRRFESLALASAATGDGEPNISGIIRGKTRRKYTWRGWMYVRADRWDAMTEAERREAVRE